ncbi:unknown protein [Seminavis robusta]|uniref:Uncharacterized protein n=1 Tax=Seminavis robusta TaxID=568900 RepID=A0A9N8EK50_9STRA|nr:unknown protein [Seminavis robusta]|eukprot:Sro1387_g268420.1 n/a (124) ;mRNA; r:29352-29723
MMLSPAPHNKPGAPVLAGLLVLGFFGCAMAKEMANLTNKQLKICSITGGAGVTREASKSIQTLFQSALEDVEYMRETWTETMKYNPETFSGISLEFLANSLDWEARGLPTNWTNFGCWYGLGR